MQRGGRREKKESNRIGYWKRGRKAADQGSWTDSALTSDKLLQSVSTVNSTMIFIYISNIQLDIQWCS